MYGGGRGMGGGGGSSMIRVVGRAVTRAGVTNLQEPISSSAATSPTSRPTHKPNSFNNNNLSLSSDSSGSALSPCNIPVSANSRGPACRPSFGSGSGSGGGGGSCCDEYEWVSVDDGFEEERLTHGLAYDDFVLGPVPSSDEVHDAVSALNQVFGTASHSQLIRDKFPYNVDKDVVDQISSSTGMLQRVSSVGSEMDWIEPSPRLCNTRMLQPYASNKVYDAFHLLQNDPSVQRMVISLSSDKTVWDAVLNNEVVRELRETYYADETVSPNTSESSDETGDESNPAVNVIMWIFDNTRAKVLEAFEKITKVVNELFKPPDDEKTAAGAPDPFKDKLRTSFLLSVVVLLIVVVSRAHRV